MKHYSASQINQYLRCPAQWAYRYVQGLKIPPSSSLVQGSSYHKAMEVNLSQKIETKFDLPTQELLDAYETEFNTRIEDVEWNAEEKSLGADKVKGKLKDEGVALTSIAHENFNPYINPKEVETPFEIHFENTLYTLNGVIDVVTDDNMIIDHKTSGKTPNAISPNEIIQGAIYCIAKNSNQVMFNYAIKLKTPKTISLPKQIEDSDKEYVLKLLTSIDQSIGQESFYPNRGSMMCSRKHCGYWMKCEEDWKGRVKD
jgi:CRISPR/Cas system-associated exonuclease Cas4 (RecB family)